MSIDTVFTKENLDSCLRQLAKEFRKLNGTTVPAEIVIVGGASVLLNYGFRDMTYDVDALVLAASSMKDAINHVGDALGLPKGWLNSDFTHTTSYTPKLLQFSRYYKTYSNVMRIRTVSGKYLVAMKLMSGRKYKNDISDIIGILREEKAKDTPLDFAKIEVAVLNLYGGWANLPEDSKELAEQISKSDNLEQLYESYRNAEKETKSELIAFEKDYPKVLTKDNMEDIIAGLKKRKPKSDTER